VGILFLINYIFTKGISPFVITRSDGESQSSFSNKPRAAVAKQEASNAGHAAAAFPPAPKTPFSRTLAGGDGAYLNATEQGNMFCIGAPKLRGWETAAAQAISL